MLILLSELKTIINEALGAGTVPAKRAAVKQADEQAHLPIDNHMLCRLASNLGILSHDDTDKLRQSYNIDVARSVYDEVISKIKPLASGDVVIEKELGHGYSGAAFLLSNNHVLKIADDDRKNIRPFIKNVLARLHTGNATKNTPMIYDWGELSNNWIWIEMARTDLAFPDDNSTMGALDDPPRKLFRLVSTIIDTLRADAETVWARQAKTLSRDAFVADVFPQARHLIMNRHWSPQSKLQVIDFIDEAWFQDYVKKYLRAVWDAYQNVKKGQLDLHTGNFGSSKHGDEFVFFDPVV